METPASRLYNKKYTSNLPNKPNHHLHKLIRRISLNPMSSALNGFYNGIREDFFDGRNIFVINIAGFAASQE